MLHTGDCFIKNMSIPLILLVVWKKNYETSTYDVAQTQKKNKTNLL